MIAEGLKKFPHLNAHVHYNWRTSCVELRILKDIMDKHDEKVCKKLFLNRKDARKIYRFRYGKELPNEVNHFDEIIIRV